MRYKGNQIDQVIWNERMRLRWWGGVVVRKWYAEYRPTRAKVRVEKRRVATSR